MSFDHAAGNGTAAAWAAKLRSVVRRHWGETAVRGASERSFRGGAALMGLDRTWVLAQQNPGASLGAAIAIALRHSPRPESVSSVAPRLELLVDSDESMLARRAELFRIPISVWKIQGLDLVKAAASKQPLAQDVEGVQRPQMNSLVAVIEKAGARAVAAEGILRAEVLGLEVGRVEIDEMGPFLSVGVGKNDRNGHQLLHGDRPPDSVLAEVVLEVRRRRTAGAGLHPANTLSQERWLREVLVRSSSIVGMSELRACEVPHLPPTLGFAMPAAARGVDADGSAVVLVCSVGIDLELLPRAADSADWLAASADRSSEVGQAGKIGSASNRLVLALPEIDAIGVQREICDLLRVPAQIRTIPSNWQAL